MAITKMPDQAADQDIGQTGLKAGAGIATGQAATPSATPVGQSGATAPGRWSDKTVKVMTPATEVTKVDARAAGATSEARHPVPIRTGARIDPPPIL
jgi:hypothetical protein